MTSPPGPDSASKALAILRRVAWLAVALAIGALAAATVFWLRPAPPARVADPGVVRLAEGAAIGGPFALTDHHGRAVTQADFADRFMLIFFGFTHCPDICPTELQSIGAAMDALGDDAARVAPLFISVDPERDTPQHLAAYVAAFHPALIGLTGTVEQIGAVAKAYKVYFSKQPTSADLADYQVDHTAFVYLMGPDGGLRSLFRSGASAETMAREIRAQLQRAN